MHGQRQCGDSRLWVLVPEASTTALSVFLVELCADVPVNLLLFSLNCTSIARHSPLEARAKVILKHANLQLFRQSCG